MTTVAELRCGDVVGIFPDGPTATFLGRSDHPTYPRLQAVVWCMTAGGFSIDALSPQQDVGQVVAHEAIPRLNERLGLSVTNHLKTKDQP